MSFPVNYSGYSTGPVPNPFMSVDMSGVPGAFGAQPPMAMGVPGLFPGMGGSMGMGGMGMDPFSAMGMSTGMPSMGLSSMGIDPMTGMPIMGASTGMPMGIDPMTGMPMMGSGGMSPMGIDPMTGMPLMGGSTGMPMGIDPMTGMPIGQQGAGFNAASMMPPMSMGPLAMDPYGGMPMGGQMPPGGSFGMPGGMPGQPQQQQEPQSPIKKMFMMLLQMKMFQQFMNPGGNEPPVDPASETDPALAADNSGDGSGEVTDNATALDILSDSKNFKEVGGADGNISFLDLSRAARTSKNADVKAAADYITKQNPQLFKQLEKLTRPGDGVFTEDDLGKALQITSIVQGTGADSVHGGSGNDTLEGGAGNDGETESITDNLSALDAFAAHFDELDENGNGQVTAAELSSAASSSDDPTLKKLAKYLRTQGLFSNVDDLSDKDGVSIKDINDAMKDPDITQVEDNTPAAAPVDVTGVTDEKAIQTINQNFAVIDALKDPKKKGRSGMSDGKLSAEDLDAVLNSKSHDVTDDMKKAAQVMKNNSLIAKLDKSEKDDTSTSGVDESKDGFVGKPTLQDWADHYKDKDTAASDDANKPADLKAAMVIINRAGTGNLFGSDKKKFTIDDVRTAMNKDGVAADVKGALKYLIDNPDKFDKLDKLDQSDDDSIQFDVVADAAQQGDDLNYFGGDPTTQMNRQALTVLDDIYDKVDNAAKGGDTDKTISDDDIKAALADRSGKFTAKQKAALAYIFNKKQAGGYTLYDEMDGKDGKIGKDQFERELLNATDDELDPTKLNSDNKLADKC